MTDAGKPTPAGRPAPPRKRRSSSPPRKSGATRPAAPDDAPLRDFATLRGRPAIFVVLNEPIQPAHLLLLREEIGGCRFGELDLVIHSGGGNIHVAYQMIQLIRQHTESMNACVPLYAKSAATLWCLAANQVVMDESAQLGPLDAQVYERTRGGGRYTSALNPFKTLEELQRFSLETLHASLNTILQRSGLDWTASLTQAIAFVQATTGQLFNRLDPEKFGEYSSALAIGSEYGGRLLRRYATNWSEATKTPILERLVRGYPSHAYIIDYRELKDMGVPVTLFPGAERLVVGELHKWIIDLEERGSVVALIRPSATAEDTSPESKEPST